MSGLSRRLFMTIGAGAVVMGRNGLATPPSIVNPSGRFRVVAEHGSLTGRQSRLIVYATDGRMTDSRPITGALGPHRTRQAFAQPGPMTFDPAGRFLIVPDLGRDRIESYSLSQDGVLAQAASTAAREGSGPGMTIFHPALPFAYGANMLNGSLTAYRFDPLSGALEPFQIVPSVPDHRAAGHYRIEIDVTPDGRFVKTADRGLGLGGNFAIDPETGRLNPSGWQEIGLAIV